MPKGNDGNFIIDEDDVSGYHDDGFDSPGKPTPKDTTSTVLTKKNNNNDDELILHGTGPTLPGVRIPDIALHPKLALGPTNTGKNRDRETLIINRTTRGKHALVPVEYPCTRPKDFTNYYPVTKPTYDKGYLNELSYNDEMKRKNAERRKKEQEREAKAAKLARQQYLHGGRKGKGPNFGGNNDGGSNEPVDPKAAMIEFFDRQLAAERRREEARTEAQEAFEYQHHNPDKKVCPSCHAVQSYAELKSGVKRCPRDSCKGALYRPKLLWSEVQGSFLGRWKDFQVKRDKHLAETIAEIQPPFRVTHRKVFNKETGEMEDQEIPKLRWEEVATNFLTRQEEVVQRLAAAAEAAKKERERVEAREKPKLNKAYKFSKPLPDFWTRQMQAVERVNLTFEERLEKLKDL